MLLVRVYARHLVSDGFSNLVVMRVLCRLFVVVIASAILISCTDFEGPSFEGLNVSPGTVSIGKAGGDISISVQAAGVWDMSVPSWVKRTIDNTNFRSFRWTVNLHFEKNTGYDRTGTVDFRMGSIKRSVTVMQQGDKGEYVPVTGVELDYSSLSLIVGEQYSLNAVFQPSTVSVKNVTWSSSNSSVASVSSSGVVTAYSVGTATITVTTTDGNQTATCSVIVRSPATPTIGTENGHEWVDLGLLSGLKWATCNIGASAPEGYGDYFAWGETSPKSDYKWSTYSWCNGSNTSITKYNTSSSYGPVVDNKTTLELADDAARVNWQGKWRMPTMAEFDELINNNNCTTEWTTQSGVLGRRITSKKNGNSIFLPAAGYRSGTSLLYAGSYGCYWSSSISSLQPPDAYNLYFASSFIDPYGHLRFSGYSVRPVCQ